MPIALIVNESSLFALERHYDGSTHKDVNE